MSFMDIFKKFSPLEEEQVKEAAPVILTPPPATATTPAPVPEAPPIYEGYDVQSAITPTMEQRDTNWTAPQLDPSKYTNDESNEVREGEFKSSLQALRDDYKAAQEDARSRQMKAEMMAALGNNIGTVVAGAQAMNTKASVTPAQFHKIDVKDMVGGVDRNFKDNYSNLLKQYKDLQDGQLSQRDLLEIDKVNLYAKMGEKRTNDSVDRTNKGAVARGATLINKAEEQDEITTKQQSQIEGIESTLDSLSKLDGMKDFSTGPISGRVEKVKRYLGQSSGNRTAMTAQLEMLTSKYGQAISGATIADAEMERIKAQLPKETDSDEMFAAKLANFQDELRNSRVRVLDSIKRSGRNVKNYENRATIEQLKGETSSAPNGQEVVERNGKTYKWNPSVGKYQLAQ